jgi:crossover junction endodeoxyribonuclease RusA
MTIDRLDIEVSGRPAPQGSKHHGEYGQMREASPYLPAWRAAVKAAVYRRYVELGVPPHPDVLPLIRGPVGVRIEFRLDTGQRIDSKPDLDKLARATFDALTQARVWEDDARVVYAELLKVEAGERETGALIRVVSEG